MLHFFDLERIFFVRILQYRKALFVSMHKKIRKTTATLNKIHLAFLSKIAIIESSKASKTNAHHETEGQAEAQSMRPSA